MNKNRELAKNTAIISIGKICTQFFSFLLLPVYTAILSTSDYGTVDLISTYQQLIGYIVFFQIEQALFRFLIDARGEKEKTQEFVTTTLIFVFIQAVILLIAGGFFYSFFKYKYALYVCMYVLAVISAGLMLQISRGFGNNFVYAIGSFMAAILTIIFNIIFLIVFKLGTTGMLLSFILSNYLCAFFVFLWLKVYQYIDVSKFSIHRLKEFLRYSMPLVPNVISWWIMSASDRTIVAFFLGTSFNGILSVAHKFSSAYTNFYTVFNLSWTESAALYIDDPNCEEFFSSVIFRVYRLFVAAAIGIIAVMPFVFGMLVNSNFKDAYYQIPIYMIAAILNVIQGLYSVIYIALKKTKEIAKATILAAAINLFGNLILIKVIGLYAAPISSVMAYGVNALVRYLDLKKYMNIKFDIRLLLSSIVMMLMVCFAYYSLNIILQMICFLIAVLYAILVNRDIVRGSLHVLKDLKNKIVKK